MDSSIDRLRRRVRRLAAALDRLESLWSRLELDPGPRGPALVHLLSRALERAEGGRPVRLDAPVPVVARPIEEVPPSWPVDVAARVPWGRGGADGAFALDGFEVLLSFAESLLDADPDPFAAPETAWVADFDHLVRGGRPDEPRALPPGFASCWMELVREAEQAQGPRRLALDMARMNALKSLTAMALGYRHGDAEGAVGGTLALHIGRARLEEQVVL